MKLSKETIEVLKNFANINPNLVVSAGNNLKTISEAKEYYGFSCYITKLLKMVSVYMI